jgi:hypothetical protein
VEVVVDHKLNELYSRIEKLEADLAAALDTRRVAAVHKRRRASYGAVIAVFAIIIAASWTLRAQTPARMPATADEQILSLLKRVTALEQRSRVRAPFEVVDAAGKVMFKVGTAAVGNGFSLFDPAGKAALTGNSTAGLFVGSGAKTQAFLGTSPDGRPAMQLTNGTGAVVISLEVNKSGAGVLEICNAGGNAMAQGGVLNGTGAGIFRTFPNGNPGAGLVGMPGTFIMGRQGK